MRITRGRGPLGLAVMLAVAVVSLASLGARGQDLPVVFEADFDGPDALAGWSFTDRAAWRASADEAGGQVLELFQQSKYAPGVRSPVNYALVEGLDLADFDLRLRMSSTGRQYGHRDLCVFFGHQDPSHFYYVHLAVAADEHAHSVFLVNGAPRVTIAKERTEGVDWSDGWHDVRVTRRCSDGRIQVYFDDLETPIMTAEDRTFAHGRIGVGSFDDTGRFDALIVRGTRHEPGQD